MFTINSYNISDINWKPVDFKPIGGQISLEKTPMLFTNGMSFNFFPFLSAVSDVSFNKKSGIILSGLNKNSYILEDKTPTLSQGLSSIQSVVTDFDFNIFKMYEIYPGVSGLRTNPFAVNANNIDISDELNFVFENNTVSIINYYGQYLTNQGPGNLIFTQKTLPINEYQRFKYVLGDGTITLFASDSDHPDYNLIATQDAKNNLILNDYDLSSATTMPYKSILYLRSYEKNKIIYDSIADSFLVKYASEPILKESTLSSIKINNNYYQNYLGIFPYENINSDGSYDFYFHGLKNYQTAEYNFTNSNNNRVYYKIYSGTNQKGGSDKIHLGYQANTVQLEFKPNTSTNFYFSTTSDTIPIQKASFIENGASGGYCPLASDRLYTSNKSNFGEIIQISNIFKPVDTHENRFLCSWLRGSKTDGDKVWYDRYYNSAFYSMDQALSSGYLVYNPKLSAGSNYYFDIPSSVILTPGVLYQYYHVGNEDSSNFITSFNFKDNSGITYSSVLNVTSWDSTLVDNSIYKNNGFSYGNSANFMGDYWELDGSNYAIFPANDVLLEPNSISVSLWLNVKDWTHVNGYQIFGNYYGSGFGLINDSQTIAPILTIINDNSQTVYNFNCRFGQISNIVTPLSTADYVQRLSDMSYWVFESESGRGVKYDGNNAMQGALQFNGGTIDQVETDASENLYLFSNNNNFYEIFDRDGAFVSSGVADPNANRIEIDLDNQVLDGTNGKKLVIGNCSVVDNNNVLWQMVGANLYKDADVYATIGASSQMTCDVYNNIWIISNDDSYTKINADGTIAFRYYFNKNPLPVETNCKIPDYIKNPNQKLYDLNEDLPFLAKNKSTYILTYDDFQEILVDPPKLPPLKVKKTVTQRVRAVDFINLPIPNIDNDVLTSVCGTSAVQYDNMVMVDMTANQAYIINQSGQLVLKLNLELLLKENEIAQFRTGGDFTGYQNIRKFQKPKNTTFSWKFLAGNDENGEQQYYNYSLKYDVSNLSSGWHNFVFVFDNNNNLANYYIDSVKVATESFPPNLKLSYLYRAPFLLGATTVKAYTLNDYLAILDGYRFIGSVGDLKIYNLALKDGDVQQLYYASSLSPKIGSLKWDMPVGYRNYIEEINEWFQFQMPTNKSKYYNINVHNLNVDDDIKADLELAIKNIIGKLSPAHTVLNQINFK